MALDATARESNVRDSIKKYFVDNLKRSEGIEVMFDKTLNSPKTTAQRTVTEWVTIDFGPMDIEALSELNLDIYCCTRQDPEGWKLAQLRDKVMGYLVDIDKTDGMARIELFRSYPYNPWVSLGKMVVQEVGPESGLLEADDDTKFKLIPIRVRWSAKG